MKPGPSDWKQLILDHYKNPRHHGAPSTIHLQAEEHNRTCGDHVRVYLSQEAPDRGSLSFEGAGCSLCIASSSLMCTLLQKVDREQCRREAAHFQRVWAEGAGEEDAAGWKLLAELRQYPVRSRCVRLPWQALETIVKEWEHEQLA